MSDNITTPCAVCGHSDHSTEVVGWSLCDDCFNAEPFDPSLQIAGTIVALLAFTAIGFLVAALIVLRDG